MARIKSLEDGMVFDGATYAVCGSEAARHYGFKTWMDMHLAGKNAISFQFIHDFEPPRSGVPRYSTHWFTIVQPEGQ